MKLLILIACLLIERYLHIGNILKRFSWLESYISMMQTKIGKNSQLSRGFWGIVVLLLPICIPIAFLSTMAVERQIGLSGAGLYFVVLLYCFGPTDLYYQLYLYFKAEEEGDKEHQAYSYNELLTNDIEDPEALEPLNERKLTETIFTQANCGIFGIVFWFCFGPLFFLVVYRILCLITYFVSKEKEIAEPYAAVAPVLYGVVNWLPARVLALLYVIAGGFQALSTWNHYLWTGYSNNQTILIECGINSLPKDKQMAPTEENKSAVTLLNRAFIIFIVFMFVFFLN